MDGQHRGALPHAAGQTGEALQIHGYVPKEAAEFLKPLHEHAVNKIDYCAVCLHSDVCRDAEDGRRPPHSQLLLLGHCHGR